MTNISRNFVRSAALAAAGSIALATPQLAAAQLFIVDPAFQHGPIDPSDPLVGIPVPGATPEEYRAHLLWNMRAGLNVAALQCQFSPYLRAVPNYNALLSQHSAELKNAYDVIFDYFKRTYGQREGTRRFDDYSTITYNNFSTLYAQRGFCQTAAAITKDALTKPKGQFHQVALNRMRELRSSLTPAYDYRPTFNPHMIRLPALRWTLDCSALRGRAKRQCDQQAMNYRGPMAG